MVDRLDGYVQSVVVQSDIRGAITERQCRASGRDLGQIKGSFQFEPGAEKLQQKCHDWVIACDGFVCERDGFVRSVKSSPMIATHKRCV